MFLCLNVVCVIIKIFLIYVTLIIHVCLLIAELYMLWKGTPVFNNESVEGNILVLCVLTLHVFHDGI
jgi:hypothetical protein